MEKNIPLEAKELIEEIGEVVELESKPKQNFNKKQLIVFFITIALILIGLLFFLIKRLGFFNKNFSSADRVAPVELITKDDSSSAIPADTSEWATYIDKEAGFSFKYPPNRVLVNSLESDLENIDGFLLSVAAEKLADIPEDLPSFMGRRDALLEKELLDNGTAVGAVKIGSLNGNVSSEYSRFEVCSLFFARKLKFYPGEHRVMMILNAPENKIIAEMPDFFKIDEANCGSRPMWDTDKRSNFDNLLKNNQGLGVAQEWYNTFNDIVKTIELFEPISVVPSSTPAQVLDNGLTYTNEVYQFKLNYEAPYRVLTSKDDLYGHPKGIALIYSGGQAYDIVIEAWDSKAAYESEYVGRMSDLTVIESNGKFITFLNNTSSTENQKIIDSVNMMNE